MPEGPPALGRTGGLVRPKPAARASSTAHHFNALDASNEQHERHGVDEDAETVRVRRPARSALATRGTSSRPWSRRFHGAERR